MPEESCGESASYTTELHGVISTDHFWITFKFPQLRMKIILFSFFTYKEKASVLCKKNVYEISFSWHETLPGVPRIIN